MRESLQTDNIQKCQQEKHSPKIGENVKKGQKMSKMTKYGPKWPKMTIFVSPNCPNDLKNTNKTLVIKNNINIPTNGCTNSC
jgi:hypothetical protein